MEHFKTIDSDIQYEVRKGEQGLIRIYAKSFILCSDPDILKNARAEFRELFSIDSVTLVAVRPGGTLLLLAATHNAEQPGKVWKRDVNLGEAAVGLGFCEVTAQMYFDGSDPEWTHAILISRNADGKRVGSFCFARSSVR